jgi:hypothetical protein
MKRGRVEATHWAHIPVTRVQFPAPLLFDILRIIVYTKFVLADNGDKMIGSNDRHNRIIHSRAFQLSDGSPYVLPGLRIEPTIGELECVKGVLHG